MNLFGLSPGELLLIGMVAMIVLGPEKLPEVAASLGKWIREFRRATEELTSQFADENPFVEIQKALSLDELLAPTIISTEPDVPAPTPVAPPVIEAPSTVAAPAVLQQPPSFPERVKSYHFLGTPNHPGLDPEWIVGAPLRAEAPRPAANVVSTDDEWLHGVPIVPEEPAAGSDAILNQILSVAAERESADPENVPASSNGHDVATDLDDLTVEVAAAETASEELAAAATNGVAEDSPAATDASAVTPVEADESPAAAEAVEEPAKAREDVTLVLEPAVEARRDETRQEPAFAGADGKGRTSEEHQP
ncbi:MAG TPA: twin-arginine translocase TatA/TatE family subunit [Chloroflexota bacterium]|nr:twin-arginine translocase TatA/TatE family subunit [Chloroflexota bacterium]